jgi:hypothetical protein
MTPLTDDEVVPGLVIQVDTATLRELGDARTNAELTATEDRAVQGAHSFLILSIDRDAGRLVAVPLFSDEAPGNQCLNEALKSGYPEQWLGVALFFSRWQHWDVPIDSVVRSSDLERSPLRNRRMYAASDPDALHEIGAWISRNRAPFREV